MEEVIIFEVEAAGRPGPAISAFSAGND